MKFASKSKQSKRASLGRVFEIVSSTKEYQSNVARHVSQKEAGKEGFMSRKAHRRQNSWRLISGAVDLVKQSINSDTEINDTDTETDNSEGYGEGLDLYPTKVCEDDQESNFCRESRSSTCAKVDISFDDFINSVKLIEHDQTVYHPAGIYGSDHIDYYDPNSDFEDDDSSLYAFSVASMESETSESYSDDLADFDSIPGLQMMASF